MRQWKKRLMLSVNVIWCKLYVKMLSPFITTRGFQRFFLTTMITGIAFAMIRMLQSITGSHLNNSKIYAVMSLVFPLIILGLVFWVTRRESVKGAALSAYAATERATKSIEQSLAERERDELSLALQEHGDARRADQIAQMTALTAEKDSLNESQRLELSVLEEAIEEEAPRRRSTRL